MSRSTYLAILECNEAVWSGWHSGRIVDEFAFSAEEIRRQHKCVNNFADDDLNPS